MSERSEVSQLERPVIHPAPYVVVGEGIDLRIKVEDGNDADIVAMAERMAEKRRDRLR